MSFIIRFSSDDTEPRYVERLNGFMPPSFTADPERARKFSREEAERYAGKFKLAAEKEGAETTSVEALEYGGPEKALSPPPRSELYIEGWGEPRGIFRFGAGCKLCLYMKKDSKGRIIYAYTEKDKMIEAMDTNGEAVVTAMCKAAMQRAVALIKAYEGRQTDGERL